MPIALNYVLPIVFCGGLRAFVYGIGQGYKKLSIRQSKIRFIIPVILGAMILGLFFLPVMLILGMNLITPGGSVFIFYWAASYYLIFFYDLVISDTLYYYVRYFLKREKYRNNYKFKF